MSRYDREPSTIMVAPLDMDAAGEDARVWLNKHREIDGKPPVIEVSVEDYGIVETADGSIYALCTEGVGPDHPISDEKPLAVDVWIRRTEADSAKAEFISMFPSCQFKLTPDEIRALPKGEPVALHDFIRTFGGRLEANYSGWKQLLEKANEVAA